jgi:hypothetical protein
MNPKNSFYTGDPFALKAKIFYHRESGWSLTTPLFYTGKDMWKFRFTGLKTGTWDIQIYSHDDKLDNWHCTISITTNQA